MNSAPEIIEAEPIAAASWLDRLRSSKGFPLPEASLGLDHFLRNCDDHRPTTTDESNENHRSERGSRVREKALPQWAEIPYILSDLFNVGSSRRACSATVKTSRKQANPRCFQSASEVAEGASSSRCAPKEDNILASTVSLNSGPDGEADATGEEDDDSGGGGETGWRGYSRSEVTIIDTSCEGWKFDKVLYRKKDNWKVRDLKGKSNSSLGGGLKKRKAEICAIVDAKKKLKQKTKTDHLAEGPSGIAPSENYVRKT